MESKVEPERQRIITTGCLDHSWGPNVC